MTVRIQSEDFDVGVELSKLSEGNFAIGGLCSFTGLVRNMAGERPIEAMILEHYPGMTEAALEKIERDAQMRWPLESTLIIHRYGKLEPGDRIVLVAVASSHRGVAFDACHFLIDWLKTRAPFWKFEQTPDGGKWVDARDSDTFASDRWIKSSA